VQFAAAFHFSTQMQVIHNIPDSSRCKNSTAYCNISVHYQMLLELFFECRKAPRLIFLEEDLEIAPDLFSYFAEFAPMLDRDDSLMCVSAWNDHGQRGRVSNASAVYRTDIFPGLGWMLGADFAREIIPDWPDMWWDEYMRRPQTRKGRQCLFPEVSRTHTYGRDGASKGQGYATYLVDMVLSSEDVNWHGRVSDARFVRCVCVRVEWCWC
jgi:alpha-1,3-mannosyl-glycoprotein beta-1,2-N-acetylglucosaminyltransferase